MKKIILVSILIMMVPLLMLGSRYKDADFLNTAIDIAAGTTKTNGTDFTSNEISVEGQDAGAITVTFTRTAGSASTVNVKFEVSYDGGTTWSDYENGDFMVATNHATISGNVVRVTKMYQFYGISHIRVKSIENSDATNNITAVQVILSL